MLRTGITRGGPAGLVTRPGKQDRLYCYLGVSLSHTVVRMLAGHRQATLSSSGNRPLHCGRASHVRLFGGTARTAATAVRQ